MNNPFLAHMNIHLSSTLLKQFEIMCVSHAQKGEALLIAAGRCKHLACSDDATVLATEADSLAARLLNERH